MDSNTHSIDPSEPSDPSELLGAPRPEGGGAGPERDPDDWVTGEEPMTAAQRSYLDTLARAAGEQLSPDLTKAEASGQIERLQGASGRGQG